MTTLSSETRTKNNPDPKGVFADALRDQIVHTEMHPARKAVYADVRASMHAGLTERLETLKFDKLYSHQAMAYDAAMEGKDLVVVTGTNSGKTLCYNLPAIQWSLSEPAARMLYLFPTKSLAQDQLGRLEKLMPTPVRAGTYDGDTPANQRSSLRKLSHIVLTNPDMLHVGILPGHELWIKFLKSLRLIVIDEMHVYRGVFGSNVANVLRRLLRLCEWHRSRPQIIACSATIGNPTELFENLTGRKATLIDEDGSPKGRRTFVFWNPPEIVEGGQRLSTNKTTSEIVAMLAETNQRTLAFSRARISAELVLKYTRERLDSGGIVDPKKIESYRAGYTVKERRQIEKDIFKGNLLGLSATNAMELGVDIGGLDAVVMNGYPGSIASFYQQAGRAGRGTHDGLAIMVAQNDPLEQFLLREPETLMDARNECVTLNPENPQVLSQQLLCAAHERPLAPSELERFGQTALRLAETMDRSGELAFRNGMFFYPSYDAPAPKVNIRGARGEQITLLHDGEELGSMERWRAMQNAHTGAIYLHRGATYIVLALDLDSGVAHVEPFKADYFTQPIVQSVIEPQVLVKESGTQSLSGVKVTTAVIGFKRRSLEGEIVLGVEDLDLPPETYDTLAVVLSLPNQPLDEDPARYMGGIHGVEHAMMSLAPLLAGCDRNDLGSAWYAFHPDTMSPAVFVYDQTPGGVGLCEKLFETAGGWIRGAQQLVSSCKCKEGCPACLLSSRCEVNNDALDKPFTLSILRTLAPED